MKHTILTVDDGLSYPLLIDKLENGAMDGAFFETYAVSEIVKSYYNAGKDRIYIIIGILTEKRLICCL